MLQKVEVFKVFQRPNGDKIVILTSDQEISLFTGNWLVNENNEPQFIIKGIAIHDNNLPDPDVILMNMRFETHCLIRNIVETEIVPGDVFWITSEG